jgi:hypothetical protein
MKKLFGICAVIIAAGLLSCSTALPETINLRFTVPSFGQVDSITCAQTTTPTIVRSVSLWLMAGTVPATTDQLVVRKFGPFIAGALDSLAATFATPGTRKFYARGENNAGRSCPTNIVIVVYDGVPPAKITDLGN